MGAGSGWRNTCATHRAAPFPHRQRGLVRGKSVETEVFYSLDQLLAYAKKQSKPKLAQGKSGRCGSESKLDKYYPPAILSAAPTAAASAAAPTAAASAAAPSGAVSAAAPSGAVSAAAPLVRKQKAPLAEPQPQPKRSCRSSPRR